MNLALKSLKKMYLINILSNNYILSQDYLINFRNLPFLNPF